QKETTMTWWGWMILGVVILGAELFAIDAQFFLVFIGVSAAFVGLTQWLGITMPEWGQWTLFAALSLISMFTFRKTLYEKIRGGVEGFKDSVAGESLTIATDVEPGKEARTQYRGTGWTVRNVGSSKIEAGSKAVIVKSEGLTLHVSAD
ncbi:MAG: NfeD family protein, partial [Woeseiaceae bacterium]